MLLLLVVDRKMWRVIDTYYRETDGTCRANATRSFVRCLALLKPLVDNTCVWRMLNLCSIVRSIINKIYALFALLIPPRSNRF